MRESEVTESAATDPGVGGRPRAASMAPTWLEYLRPLRFDHWIKNLVVPVGSLLALAARRSYPDGADVAAILLAFVVSGLVSSVNYAVNEVLDAPFDARHPTKRDRPIPSDVSASAPSWRWPRGWRFWRSRSRGGFFLPPCSWARAPCSSPGSCTTSRPSGSRTGRTSTRSPNPSRIPFGSRSAGTRWRRAPANPPAGHRMGVRAFLMTGQAAGRAPAPR